MNGSATTRPLVIIGAGGFGREVLDVIEAADPSAQSYEVLGFIDDGSFEDALIERRGHAILGTSAWLDDHDADFTIAIGQGSVREQLAQRLEAVDRQSPILLHPSATFGGDNTLGAGTIVCAGVNVTTNVQIGQHVQINLAVTVGHDAVLHDYVTVLPGSCISGAVTIGKRTTIGTGASILPGVTIGDDAFVGAGAVVTRDVDAGQTVVGVPAKPLR